MQARIEKRDTDWIIITDDETYRVSSINNHCENKLQAMHNNGQQVHLQFEEIGILFKRISCLGISTR